MTVGDYGAVLTIRIRGIDLALVDSVSIVVKKPDGSRVVWTPATAASGVVTYGFVPGDLDQPGNYCGDLVVDWGILADPPGRDTSSIFTFTIDPGL